MDYYQVLGVSATRLRTTSKSLPQACFQYHQIAPDSKDADAKIRELNAAYEIIGDADKRRSYDRLSWGDEPRAERLIPASFSTTSNKSCLMKAGRTVFNLDAERRASAGGIGRDSRANHPRTGTIHSWNRSLRQGHLKSWMSS